MSKQIVVAEVALQVAVALRVDGKHLWHVETQVMEMPAEADKGLVFLDVAAVGAYQTARFRYNPEIPPCRP